MPIIIDQGAPAITGLAAAAVGKNKYLRDQQQQWMPYIRQMQALRYQTLEDQQRMQQRWQMQQQEQGFMLGRDAQHQKNAFQRQQEVANAEARAQVATREEQKRRLAICNACQDLNMCLPTPCAKRKAWETGSCPQGKWKEPDYRDYVSEAVDLAEFSVRYPGFERTGPHLRLSTEKETQPKPVRLYAMISTWHEADIVAAAVKNCFAEGCDRVYVIDNDSPDGTAHEAVKAGAIVARSFTTGFYQDMLRIRLMNETMQAITEAEKWPTLWWMALDCDEMPRGPGRRTVRQFLATIPADCNMVGACAFDHYPTRAIANVRGRHPAEYQPFGWFRICYTRVVCPNAHWKHPLTRYNNGKWTAVWQRGLHTLFAKPEHGTPIEPSESLLLHHFMFRNEDETRERLNKLCGGGDTRRSKPDDERLGNEGAFRRWQMLDKVYTQDWVNIRMPHLQCFHDLPEIGAPVKHWSHWFKPHEYLPRELA